MLESFLSRLSQSHFTMSRFISLQQRNSMPEAFQQLLQELQAGAHAAAEHVCSCQRAGEFQAAEPGKGVQRREQKVLYHEALGDGRVEAECVGD